MIERNGLSAPSTGTMRGVLVAALAIAFIAASGWYVIDQVVSRDPGIEAPAMPVIETSRLLSLVDHQGRPLQPAALATAATMVFFGYTHCPDVCPLELATMATALDRLGPLAGSVGAFFVTVDPERDTPARLAAYVASFDDRITGLTGEPASIAAAAAAFRAYYERVELDNGDYSVDHFARTLVLDRDGHLVAAIPFDSPPEILEQALRPLLESASPS